MRSADAARGGKIGAIGRLPGSTLEPGKDAPQFKQSFAPGVPRLPHEGQMRASAWPH
ncbi:MAG TPA: hypothetical protein VMM15_43810 [Bradyrhizobium sp.]|nr:hypothetical protein [Bradyrhizobium sp.]